jgi:hypothetical protein
MKMAKRPFSYHGVFDPSKPLYVRRVLKANGQKFNKGDRFLWHRMAVSKRRVRQMFYSGKLTHGNEEKPEQKKPNNTTVVSTDTGPVQVQKPDELDDINYLNELQKIAKSEGAPLVQSKSLQRKKIRENRAEQS